MKNSKIFTFTLLLAISLFCPFKVEAKQENTCVYKVESQELIFKLNSNKVETNWKDGDSINGKIWYQSNNLSDEFLRASVSEKGTVCPTISVEENDGFNMVMLNPIDPEHCNGICKTVNAEENAVAKTVIGNSVGVYGKTSYFIPYFRMLNDGTIEWSIDGSNYKDISKSISYNKVNNITIDKNIAKDIFTNETQYNNIYRCVVKKDGKYEYKLTNNKKACPKNDISEKDGQAKESLSYNGALGASCTDTILGDPADENSTAWLLKQIFNYLKVLGPMIILVMSAIDFTKAIIAGDDDTMQKCYKRLITRLILAVALFVVPTLVEVLLDVFGITGGPVCVLN